MEDTMALVGEKGVEPGLNLDEVIQKGDNETPQVGGMSVTSAGYTIVYDTVTGIGSKINNNNLIQVLKKKRTEEPNIGSPVFGLKQTVKPMVGDYKCLLHKDDPNRKHYDEIGLAVCPKDNLASSYQVMRHMQKRHKTEWGAIDQERIDKEKQEDREFQRSLMTGAFAKTEKPVAEKAPLYVKDRK